MAIRRNIKTLTNAERVAYVQGVKAMQANNTYRWYVEAHLSAIQHPTGGGSTAAHKGPAFLPWHRQFILLFERGLQDALSDSEFGLPYWDSVADSELPRPQDAQVWATDFMGGDGSPVSTGPFIRSQWRAWPDGYLNRSFGTDVPSLPDNAARDAALAVSVYDSAPWNDEVPMQASFRNSLEGWVGLQNPNLHNRTHAWIGGSMGLIELAPNDPVFFLHHCNVDRLWAEWQARFTDASYPVTGAPTGHNLNDPMFPWNTTTETYTPGSVLNHFNLGYMFDTEITGALTYGSIVYIQNGYEAWAGGYLDTRGRGCNDNLLCVSTSSSADRDSGSGRWKLVSASGKVDGAPVLANDDVHFQNQYANGGYLDTRGRGCKDNLLCVSSADSATRENGSGTWRVLAATGSDPLIRQGQAVRLVNGYSGFTGGFLDTRGRGCNDNLLCVSTTANYNRDSDSTLWRFAGV